MAASYGMHRRYALEAQDGENAGLLGARAHLEACKAKHPWCSYSDLWVSARCARCLSCTSRLLVVGVRKRARRGECSPRTRRA